MDTPNRHETPRAAYDRVWRQLNSRAEQAEQRYYETVRSRTGREWWNVCRAVHDRYPEIRAALTEKIQADAALLTFMRTLRRPEEAHK